jgi:tetratricopeptide (TPR) repeat protein
VSGPPDPTLLERGRAAASRGGWQEAYDLLTQADSGGLLDRANLPLLADVAYAAGHLDVTIEVWERVHAECVRSGDVVAAAGAAARVAMHLLFDAALMAPVRGWLARAERLLEGHDDTPVHAWVAVVRSYERLLVGDLEKAGRWARRAIEVGSKRDPAAAAIGRVAEARSLLLAGEVQQGLLLLDEAAVAAVSGELDPLSTGVVYCELVCAFQGAAQYDLAEEWTEAMERWRPGGAIGSVHGRCRVHRAEILRLRGHCDEAEKEALAACAELRPYLRRELGWPLYELGRIRLVKGDIDGAEEAFLAAHEAGWDPQPGLSLVRLAQGDVGEAATSIREALDHPLNVPSKELPSNTELRRAPLLEASVQIEIAAGDIDRARAAAQELEQVAARFESKALAAGAALAQGRVRLASGVASEAEPHFQLAVRLWNEVGAPYETALAKAAYGDARRAGANQQRAGLGAGESPPGSSETPPTGANTFRCEGDYWLVAFEGRPVRVRDLKGMHYLSRLLADPGREFHALDLVALESPGNPALSDLGDAGEMLDPQAKQAYRRRLVETEEDLEQARLLGDPGRENQVEAERDFLLRELSRAVGLGGRDRRAGSSTERARASVTRAIRQAITRIGEHDQPLGKHLAQAIHTGAVCVYRPDPRLPAQWRS